MFEPTPFLVTDRLSRPVPGSSQLRNMVCLTWHGSRNTRCLCGVNMGLEIIRHGRGGRVFLSQARRGKGARRGNVAPGLGI
jgi:hypothetical protein